MTYLVMPPDNAIRIEFRLPRAPRSLSPNRRGSTANGSRERATYREGCRMAIKADLQAWRKANPDAPGLDTPLWTRLRYGTKRLGAADTGYRPRDAHNAHGPGKAIIDALAATLGIDDCHANFKDLGAEIDPSEGQIVLTVYFTPSPSTSPHLPRK